MEPVVVAEGRGVLHLLLRVDHAAVAALPPGAGKDLADTLGQLGDEVQLHLFTTLGHKADVMVMALAEDVTELRRVQTAILSSQAGPALQLAWSYFSLTETSDYTPTRADEVARLTAAGVAGDGLERRLAKFEARTAEHNRHKLYPDMPRWEVACFYPMSHRRAGGDNWYALPFDERRRLMHEHGKSGRAYTGRVVQLVTGSTGLDDWEWGVTLFAHDLADVKDIVYRLRYDEASARFAEFGPFVVGLRRSPADLVAEIGLARGA